MSKKQAKINPELLSWAIERSVLKSEELTEKFPALDSWLDGLVHPSYTELKKFASATRAPYNAMFLRYAPPGLPLPISDFRTFSNAPPKSPSSDLVETIYQMKRRQYFLSGYRIKIGHEAIDFVAAARLTVDPLELGAEIRKRLGSDLWFQSASNWEGSVGKLRASIDNVGVMAIVIGVVGNNTRKNLIQEYFSDFLCTMNMRHSFLLMARQLKQVRYSHSCTNLHICG